MNTLRAQVKPIARPVLLLAALLTLPPLATPAAATTYRCVAGGKVAYGDSPCVADAPVSQSTVPAAPEPSAQERALALRRAQAEKRELAELEKRRRAEEQTAFQRQLYADAAQARLAQQKMLECQRHRAMAAHAKARQNTVSHAPGVRAVLITPPAKEAPCA